MGRGQQQLAANESKQDKSDLQQADRQQKAGVTQQRANDVQLNEALCTEKIIQQATDPKQKPTK
jgi:hypothetical protein